MLSLSTFRKWSQPTNVLDGPQVNRPELPLAKLPAWASPREVYNVVQAHQIGCHIITMAGDLIPKLAALGKDLDQFSLKTVRMFRNDSLYAGFSL